jgi:TolB-like protein
MQKIRRSAIGRGKAAILVIALGSSFLFNNTATGSPLTGGSSGSAAPFPQYSLAVLSLEATGRISTEEAAMLTDRLSTELGKTGAFNLIDRSVIESTLQSAGLSEVGCSTVDCAMQAGKALTAQLVVTGSVRKVGPMIFIETQIIHVSSGQVVQKVSEDFDGDVNRLLNHMRGIARKLVGGASPSTSSARPVSVTESSQELTTTEYAGANQDYSGDTSDTTENGSRDTEMKRGSNKLLIFGLVAAGAVGAGVLISQSRNKDGGDGKDDGQNNLPDLPGPPQFRR